MNEVEQAEKALADWDAAHQVESTDPGMQSMRFHQTQQQRNKGLRSYLNQLKRESDERDRLVRALADARRAERVAALPTEPVDPTELQGATWVWVKRWNRMAWHQVKRVNKRTVTCENPPGFEGYDPDKFRHDQIYGVKYE